MWCFDEILCDEVFEFFVKFFFEFWGVLFRDLEENFYGMCLSMGWFVSCKFNCCDV